MKILNLIGKKTKNDLKGSKQPVACQQLSVKFVKFTKLAPNFNYPTSFFFIEKKKTLPSYPKNVSTAHEEI